MHPLAAALAAESWAMEPTALERFMASLAAIDPKAGMFDDPDEADDVPPYALTNGLATIAVAGVLMKSVSPILRYFGINATGYAEISAALDAAAADPAVDRVMLEIDSPGGAVSGVQALADKIRAFNKPTIAHCNELCASAAYWLAAQADEVTGTRGAQVGSIGVFVAVVDRSQAAAAAGIRVHVISSGAHKGAGVPGAAITDEQIAEIRRSVLASAQEFVADVAAGRGESPAKVQESADGRVFSAADAQTRGLIDRIAADPRKEYIMSKSVEQMAALIKANPARAQLIAEMAVTDADETAIKDAIVAADAADAKAKAEADAKAAADELTKAKDELATAEEATAKLQADHDALKAKHDALAALKAGAAGNKVQPEGDTAKPAERMTHEAAVAAYGARGVAARLADKILVLDESTK